MSSVPPRPRGLGPSAPGPGDRQEHGSTWAVVDRGPRPPDIVGRPKPPEPDRKDGLLSFLKELPVLIIVAFAIALVIKTFLVQAFFIPSRSMEPTLLIGDRVLVAKFLYRFTDAKHGDVVVFRSPLPEPQIADDGGIVGKVARWIGEGLGVRSSERDLIKRVVASEFQTIQIREGKAFVDGKLLDERYLRNVPPMPDFGPYRVPANHVFVMGDNRGNSQDSRVFGAVDEQAIVGRAFILIWPPNRISTLSHRGP